MNKRNRRKSGFTLIEIMLVVVIIAIMAGVALPKLTGHTQKARITKTEQTIDTLGMAIRMFEMDMGRYPRSLEELVSGSGENWNGPYLEKTKLPKDPWGKDFIYSAPGSHNRHSFDLSSSGPEGGEAIGNWED